MLILSRKSGQSISIGADVTVTFCFIDASRIQFRVHSPKGTEEHTVSIKRSMTVIDIAEADEVPFTRKGRHLLARQSKSPAGERINAGDGTDS